MEYRNLVVLLAFLCAVTGGTAVNFLAKRAALNVPPIALNGWRTLTAAAIVLLPALWLGVPLRLTFAEFWQYTLLAALTMAIPHALIFFALRNLSVTETTVAFVEAAVLGVVIVYLLAGGRGVSAASVFCAVLSLVGLAVFLGIGPSRFPVSTGDGFILAAAVATAFGMILSGTKPLQTQQHAMKASAVLETSTKELKEARENKGASKGQLRQLEQQVENLRLQVNLGRSLRKTLFSCALAGSGTLAALAGMNLIRRRKQPSGVGVDPVETTQSLVPVPARSSWPWVITLAVVGNCLTWFSVFLLIEFGQLILAAAVVAAIPVATELANYIWFPPGITNRRQRIGGAMVLASLAALIWFQFAPVAYP
jgi:drug/metabolite transporter (DMT)-like permease